jgi:hypothetical protein
MESTIYFHRSSNAPLQGYCCKFLGDLWHLCIPYVKLIRFYRTHFKTKIYEPVYSLSLSIFFHLLLSVCPLALAFSLFASPCRLHLSFTSFSSCLQLHHLHFSSFLDPLPPFGVSSPIAKQQFDSQFHITC